MFNDAAATVMSDAACGAAMRASVLALVAALLLAGCLGSAETPPPASGRETVTLTAPDAVAPESMASGDRWHVHDYWGGAERLTVTEASDETGMSCGGCDQPFPFTSVRPAPKEVVPQGASRVLVTVSWQETDGSDHGPVTLWVKTAADAELMPLRVVESGDTVEIETTNDMDDPPHQVLSLWQFGLGTEGPGGDYSFRGTITFLVEAVRGLPIPEYPPHPDLWDGASELPLMDESGGTQLMYQHDGNTNCQNGCLGRVVPSDGQVVPYDATEVVVTLTYGPGVPATLGLAYHAADTWDLAPLEGKPVGPDAVEYRIPVTVQNGDSPYARQSLWEFEVYIDQPTPLRAWSGTFTLQAKALKA